MTVNFCPDCNHPRGVSFGSPYGMWSPTCPHPFIWKDKATEAGYRLWCYANGL